MAIAQGKEASNHVTVSLSDSRLHGGFVDIVVSAGIGGLSSPYPGSRFGVGRQSHAMARYRQNAEPQIILLAYFCKTGYSSLASNMKAAMDRKEPKFIDIRGIIQRLETLEGQGVPADSQKLADLQDLDERVMELERRVDELTDLVDKLKAVLTL